MSWCRACYSHGNASYIRCNSQDEHCGCKQPLIQFFDWCRNGCKYSQKSCADWGSGLHTLVDCQRLRSYCAKLQALSRLFNSLQHQVKLRDTTSADQHTTATSGWQTSYNNASKLQHGASRSGCGTSTAHALSHMAQQQGSDNRQGVAPSDAVHCSPCVQESTNRIKILPTRRHGTRPHT